MLSRLCLFLRSEAAVSVSRDDISAGQRTLVLIHCFCNIAHAFMTGTRVIGAGAKHAGMWMPVRTGTGQLMVELAEGV